MSDVSVVTVATRLTFGGISLIISAKEVMFSTLLVCLSVC